MDGRRGHPYLGPVGRPEAKGSELRLRLFRVIEFTQVGHSGGWPANFADALLSGVD